MNLRVLALAFMCSLAEAGTATKFVLMRRDGGRHGRLGFNEKAAVPFEEIDQNHDGVINRTEFTSQFDEMDQNNDGVVNSTEFIMEFGPQVSSTASSPNVTVRWQNVTGNKDYNITERSVNITEPIEPSPAYSPLIVYPSADQIRIENQAIGCVTIPSPLARDSLVYSVAPAGTPCMFRVDEMDEARHCMDYESGKYGQHGWCWTNMDKSEWGSCSSLCPYGGQSGLLREKVHRLEQTVLVLDAVTHNESVTLRAHLG